MSKHAKVALWEQPVNPGHLQSAGEQGHPLI